MKDQNTTWLRTSPAVEVAIQQGKPVVALESTVITHGLHKPVNLDMALQMEQEIRDAGVVPATTALIKGQVCLGLSTEEIEELALTSSVEKVSRRDLGWARVKGLHGGTTVAATMYIAYAKGVRVFATGGIGGVHRGDRRDVSADLTELAETPLAVVCSGAKAILDLPRTLEWLETAGVLLVGWQTTEFPAFFSISSGLPVNVMAENADEVAEILDAHWEMGLPGVLVCVPCPEEDAVEAGIAKAAIEQAEEEAIQKGIRGKALTPYLLTRIAELTDWATLRANLALLRQNARVAALLAKALVKRNL